MTAKTMICRFPAVVCILLTLYVAEGFAQDTKLKWLGHAAFIITTPKGKVLLIDPWLKQAIPHHFGTFPGITQDATEFAAALKPRGIAFREMKPGDTLTFQGNRIR